MISEKELRQMRMEGEVFPKDCEDPPCWKIYYIEHEGDKPTLALEGAYAMFVARLMKRELLKRGVYKAWIEME
jgi:hypothetical protein